MLSDIGSESLELGVREDSVRIDNQYGYAPSAMSLENAKLCAAIGAAVIASCAVDAQSQVAVPEVPGQGLRVDGTEQGERFGASASGIGDFNGDGFADFAVGSVQRVTISGLPARKAQVLFGGRGSAPVFSDNLSGRGFTIFNSDNPGYIGRSVSGAGDINGDGFSDLIVSANIVEPSVSNERGAFVVFGNSGETDVNLADLNGGGFRIDVTDMPSTEGLKVSGVGDINGDGLDDIAIGFPKAEGATALVSGRAYVVFGSTASETIDVQNLGLRGFAIGGANEGDQLGYSISGAGDVNGDGFDDIIIGLPTYAREGTSGSGKAVVVFGDNSNDFIDITNLGDRGFQMLGVASEDFVGIEVDGLGDVNGDGFADVGIGSILRFGNQRIIPEAYIVYGQSAPSDIDFANASPAWFRILGTDEDTYFGRRISAAGDVNGDGLGDIMIGAERARSGSDRTGKAFVIYGATRSSDLDLAVETDVGFMFTGETNSLFGCQVSAAGDINGDGLNDLVIGALGIQNGTNTSAGAVFIPYNINDQSVSGQYLLRTGSGDAPKQGVGSLGNRSNHGFPEADIWINFDDGSAGSGTASTTIVTLFRNLDKALKGGEGKQWKIDTDRLNWTSLDVEIRLKNDESSNVPPSSLAVHFSPDGQSPFSPLDSVIDLDRRTISAQLSATGYLRVRVKDPVFTNGFEFQQ